MGWIAGLDLGGTRLRATAVDAATGVVLRSTTSDIAAHPVAAGDEPFGLLVRAVEHLAAVLGGPPVALGLGATGPVHPSLGTITNADTLPPTRRGPVVAILHRAFSAPVCLLNDADAFALGEYRAEATGDAGVVVGVTMGTGVGVGVVRDGVPVTGQRDSHPEAGHMLLDPSGPPCYCGARGCWERYCSGTAIAEAMDRVTGSPAGTWTGREVARAAERGDPAAWEVFDVMGAHLGLALTNLVAVLGPQVVVLGGGVAESRSLYLPQALDVLARFKYQSEIPLVIRPALLGDMAGSLGAAFAAAGALGTSPDWRAFAVG